METVIESSKRKIFGTEMTDEEVEMEELRIRWFPQNS